MSVQICDLSSRDMSAAVRLLEELKGLPDSNPIEITQFVSEVNDGAVVVAAISGNELIGLATARVAGDRAWTQLIAIAPRWRNQGVGSALTAGLESRLLNSGVRKVAALVGPGKSGEQALINRGYTLVDGMVLYEKSLFAESGETQVIERWGGQMMPGDLWGKLAGMEREKDLINSRIVAPLANPELAAEVGLKLPSTVLMFGPPGTGKTSFARALASRLSWPFIELLPSKLASGGGPLADEIREAFSELSTIEHVVIFIDEFDELTPAREGSPTSSGVVNELLKSIPRLRERPGKLLVCATNFVESIDPAILRPGRFDLLIGIGPPDETALYELWRQALRPIETEEIDLQGLVGRCRGFTPGDVDLAAQRAAAKAFMRKRQGIGEAVVTADDLADALRRTKPSVTTDLENRFRSEVELFERI